jgi:16S rRNA (cytosine967-C5)-methyltransferase
MRLLAVMTGRKPREITLQVLQRRQSGGFVEDLLETALARTRLIPEDRHLCQQLVYGIVRWEATLDWLITRKAARPPSKPLLQNILRLGLFQIFWLQRVPPHAAVNETVELARQMGCGAQTGFINALLRNYLREFDATNSLLAGLKASEPHLGYSHPQWLAARWQIRWGAGRTAQLLEWNNRPPATFARVHTLKTDAGRLLQQWREEGVEYDFVRRDWLPENLVFNLKSHPPLNRLESFRLGLFYVQDPSTLLAPLELAPRPGEAVLDLCAAPGGKLTFLAALMGNQGELVAHDAAPERLRLVEENCARLGVTCARPVPPAFFQENRSATFDRILIDAPCSNTGVMGRRVDLRWRIRPEEIQRLSRQQLDLLRQAAGHLKPGGVLVYSTCSLEPEENGCIVKEFLAEHPEFRLERERELLPFQDHVDGAYVVRLSRRNMDDGCDG